jgi:hypothetical protein
MKLLQVMACLGVLALAHHGLAAAAAADQVGRVSYLEGSVRIQRDGAWLAGADIGTRLENDDLLATGADGVLEIELDGRTGAAARLRLRPSTSVVLDMTVLGGGPRTGGVELLAGSVYLKVQKLLGGNQLQVRTGMAVCSVRGTRFEVALGPGGEFLVGTSEGRVETRLDGQDAFSVGAGKAWAADGEGMWQARVFTRNDTELLSRQWRQEQADRFRDDPQAVLARLEARQDAAARELAGNLGQQSAGTAGLSRESAGELRAARLAVLRSGALLANLAEVAASGGTGGKGLPGGQKVGDAIARQSRQLDALKGQLDQGRALERAYARDNQGQLAPARGMMHDGNGRGFVPGADGEGPEGGRALPGVPPSLAPGAGAAAVPAAPPPAPAGPPPGNSVPAGQGAAAPASGLPPPPVP